MAQVRVKAWTKFIDSIESFEEILSIQIPDSASKETIHELIEESVSDWNKSIVESGYRIID